MTKGKEVMDGKEVMKKSKQVIQQSSWLEKLPEGFLSAVADRLSIDDFFSFRGTCKELQRTSSHFTFSPTEYMGGIPWLIVYGDESPKCVIYDPNKNKLYNAHIPGLQGATCLASYQGWMLLARENNVSFFCPFSRATIHLPNFPHDHLDHHIASFSDLPTTPGCLLSVISPVQASSVEIHLLTMGNGAWTSRPVNTRLSLTSSFMSASFETGSRTFYFVDDNDSILIFSVDDERFEVYQNVKLITDTTKVIPFSYAKNEFRKNLEDYMQKFNLEQDEHFHVRGLTFKRPKEATTVYADEILSDGNRIRKVVWIQPRFYDPSDSRITAMTADKVEDEEDIGSTSSDSFINDSDDDEPSISGSDDEMHHEGSDSVESNG